MYTSNIDDFMALAMYFLWLAMDFQVFQETKKKNPSEIRIFHCIRQTYIVLHLYILVLVRFCFGQLNTWQFTWEVGTSNEDVPQ